MENLTGSYHKGNYVWAIGMNLAWNELVNNVIKGKVDINTEDEEALRLFNLFDAKKYKKQLLAKTSYYVNAGFGQKKVTQIQAELKAKFPTAITDLLDAVVLTENEIISLGYLNKKFTHRSIFVEREMLFRGKKVKGFGQIKEANSGVEIVFYTDEDNFLIKLLSNNGVDGIYLMKGNDLNLDELINYVSEIKGKHFEKLKAIDDLLIPSINLTHERSYDELIGHELINRNIPSIFFGTMKEQVRFSMDYKGASVENEAVITMTRGVSRPKKLHLDKPFSLIMKETTKSLPYLAIRVENEAILAVE